MKNLHYKTISSEAPVTGERSEIIPKGSRSPGCVNRTPKRWASLVSVREGDMIRSWSRDQERGLNPKPFATESRICLDLQRFEEYTERRRATVWHP